MSNVAAAAEASVALLDDPFKWHDVIGGGQKQEGKFSDAEKAAIVALVRKYGSQTFTRMVISDPVLQARTYQQLAGCWYNMVEKNIGLKDLVAADASHAFAGTQKNGGYRALVIDADGGLSIVCFPTKSRAGLEQKNQADYKYEYRIAKDLQGRGVKINIAKVEMFLRINGLDHGGSFLHIVLPSPAQIAAAATLASEPFFFKDVIGGGEMREGIFSAAEKAAMVALVRKHKTHVFTRMVIDDPALQGRSYRQLQGCWKRMIKADPSLENLLAADAPDPSKPTPRFLLYPANDSNGWDNAEHVPPSDPSRSLSEIKKELDSIKKRKGDALRSGLLQPRLPPIDVDYPSRYAFGLAAKRAHVLKQMEEGTFKSNPVRYDDLLEGEKKNYEEMATAEVERYEKAKREYVPSHPAYRKEDGRRLDLVGAEHPMMDPDLPCKPRHRSGWHKFAFRKGEKPNLAKRSEEWDELDEDEKTPLIEEVDNEWKQYNSLMKAAFEDGLYKANDLYGHDGKLREKYWSNKQKLQHASGNSMFKSLAAPRVVVNGRRTPGAPKPPINAFGHFCKSKGAAVMDCSNLWNSLSDEEKHPFQLMSDTDVIRYSREMDDYRDIQYQEEGHLRSTKKLPSREAATGEAQKRKRERTKSKGGRKKERLADDMDVQEEKYDDDIETVGV